MEDVAREAGIAKGTVYLHFDNKEALFKALIRSATAAPIGRIEELLESYEGSTEALLRTMLDVIKREILETDRRLVVQLVLTEGHRFPEVADFYYAAVVSRAIGFLRAIIERGVARGEFADNALVRFPQLVIAPFLVAVMWQGLFEQRAALDADGMIRAHLDLLMRALKRESP